jgi:hypothetical protein
MSAIRVVNGTYRNKPVRNQEFVLVSGFQTGAKGNYVTVKNDGAFPNCPETIRISVDNISNIEYTNGMTQPNTIHFEKQVLVAESDEDAMTRIRERFDILTEMTKAATSGDIRAMIVSGPPGVGKSFGVESTLERFSTFDDIAGAKRKFEMVKGAMSAIGLYKKLYEHKDPGHVVCFDDCDAILYDDLSLNLLKAALDSGKKRMLHWNTESRTLYQEGMPNSFEFQAGVIFITNIKFDNVKSKKLQDHLQALQSRCHYLDLTIDSMRDRMLRIKQICRQGMLDRYAMTQEEQAQLVAFIFENRNRLREVSLRMVLKIADLWKMAPDRYQALAHQTCMKAGV